MRDRFIEITLTTGGPAILNTQHIVAIAANRTQDTRIITLSTGQDLTVSTTLTELRQRVGAPEHVDPPPPTPKQQAAARGVQS